jgi:hypothetical protein
LGFVTFCIAGVCLLYGVFNFLLPIFWEHGLAARLSNVL